LASDLVQQLIDSGIHFGHKSSRWNPKMKPYILGKRNTVHLIDIKETIRGLLQAKKFISHVVSKGQDILFVGTKRQAKHSVRAAAEQSGMHYVSERWLGGTLTNFRTIRSRLTRLEELEEMEKTGQLFTESKKTISRLTREKKKILCNLEGIRRMSKLPGALCIIDARHEMNAVLEARKIGITSICLLDTDSDPDLVDIPIPGNDDAMRGIELILGEMASAIEAGKHMRPAEDDQAGASDLQQRKRSRRPTTSQMAEKQETWSEASNNTESSESTNIEPSTENSAVIAVAEPEAGPDNSTAQQQK